MKKLLLILLILLIGLAACGGEGVTPTPIPPPADAGTDGIQAVPPTDTATDAAAPTLQPTLPPPPTIAPPPPTPTPLLQPTETPTGSDVVTLLTPEDFGENRNPLTGEIVDDPAVLERRPLTIKISNAPAAYVRPQSGLNKADWVFEHTAEGAVTRFTILVYGKTPEKVGPIRSARLIDLELPQMYDAALVYSGTSVGVGRRMAQSPIADQLVRTNEPGYYRTGDESKPYEHTLYAIPENIWEGLEARGINTPPQFNTQVAFSTEMPENGRPATEATIDYKSTFVRWVWDEENGRYLREADRDIVIDENDGEQVSAANVVIISPFHVEDPTICEQIANGECVALSVQIQLWGTGQGVVLRDGQVFDVTWRREAPGDMLTFTNMDGNPFPLQIGNTWVQLVPSWLTDPVQILP
ncbi:MAG TPA: DUF3048 domain-containing protein [Anaerolineae bacterium]|nr:DUF3048 domain-containing protein [Anaerolineae bacterium]